MLKFFRKIRQKLLVENRFNKPASPPGSYLLYAIDEIVLVVIGILIAQNLAPTLKGGFSNLELLSADIPLGSDGFPLQGVWGQRKGKTFNQ